MKRLLAIMIIGTVLLSSGCGDGNDVNKEPDGNIVNKELAGDAVDKEHDKNSGAANELEGAEPEQTETSTTEKPSEAAEPNDEKDSVGEAAEPNDEEDGAGDADIRLQSDAEIKAYIEGEWTLVDRDSGDDFATIVFGDDGSLKYTRLSDGVSCDGQITFEISDKEDEIPGGYTLKLTAISEFMKEQDLANEASDSQTSGIFHIGIGAGEDYLYLSEIGNGDTPISRIIFNTHDPNDYENWTNEWLFIRKNNAKVSEPLKNTEFYVFAWGRGDDGSILLQKMKANEFDSNDEFTDRAFRAAYFAEEEDLSVTSYEISDEAAVNNLYLEERFKSCPLYVYRVKTDSQGIITQITEIDSGYYGMYDLGSTKPSFHTDGTTFYYNNITFNVQDIAPAANAIMDCQRVGDYIIVDCHVNPHVGLYEFFNIYAGDFVYEIAGTNLIWKGDDIATAVYSQYNEIYDFWGNMIGSVTEGEVFGLEFGEGDVLSAKCWIINGDKEEEFNEDFEYEPVDSEMLSYYNFLLGYGKASLWRAFRERAPENAGAYVIVNAPDCIYDRIPRPFIYEEGALDTIAVVSFTEKARVHIENSDEGADEEHEISKGNPIQYSVTVPEGIPNNTLKVRDDNGNELEWMIAQISGRVPQRTIFLEY